MTPGKTIDGRYRVDSIHSADGGMGSILLVHDLEEDVGPKALKYCRDDNEENLKRFRREVRLMAEFAGNHKIVQILDSGLSHEPPYLVMPFYPAGDLRSLAPNLIADIALQENLFLQMADCVHELHQKNIYHRDIKPQNFLIDGARIVISDLGLSMELESRTLFTQSNQSWGTHGFIPPEFTEPGGFKNAKVESDIYMLGKSMYALLTGRDPTYLNLTILPPTLGSVIDRCCQNDPAKRFSSISEIKQSLVAAYNVINGKTNPLNEADFILDNILQDLRARGSYDPAATSDFISRFCILGNRERWMIIEKFERGLFVAFSDPQVEAGLVRFLDCYLEAVSEEANSFSFAETVADSMQVIFKTAKNSSVRARALEIAVIMATRMNRFAAMDTCEEMITSVTREDQGGADIAAAILRTPADFMKAMEIVNVKNPALIAAIQSL